LYIPVIDKLRGLAALSVAWFHLTNGYESWVATTGSLGWLGVEAFFVISGFMIPYALSQLEPPYQLSDFPRFILRRLVRLEPPYIASILLVVAANLVAAASPMFNGAPPEFQPAQLAAHLLYLIPFTGYDWLQPVYWTLAFEFAFYLSMGLAFPLLGASTRPWIARILAGALIGLVAMAAVNNLVLLFVMGFVSFRRVALRDSLGWTACLLLVCTLALGLFRGIKVAIVGLATALAIVGHQLVPQPPRWLGAALGGLGAISYSLYLVHVPMGGKVVNLGGRFVEGPVPELVLSLIALAISIAAALVFYWVIERPAVLLARRVRVRARAVDAPAASKVIP
jgi:peptidoglycan/LPS O-acetylase OafA/YrhL